jgi:hypothetical protein
MFVLRASEGMLSRCSWLHLQSLAPTNPHWARVVGYGPFSLCVILKEGLRLRGLRQSNNLKTIAKLEKYKMNGIDTSRDKLRYFNLVSLTCLTLTAKFSLTIDKIYYFNL